jgi:6-phosphogluconolactonase (cycloisomerase 2 family)
LSKTANSSFNRKAAILKLRNISKSGAFGILYEVRDPIMRSACICLIVLCSTFVSLTQISGSPFRTRGQGGQGPYEALALATLQGRTYLYASNDLSGNITGFSISATTGNLQLVPGSPFPADAAKAGNYSLDATPNGEYLFATSDATEVIHVYLIGTGGGLEEIAGSPFQSGARIESLKVTPNGKYLVAAANSRSGVGVFSIASSGALTQIASSPFPASGTVNSVAVNCPSSLVFAASNNSNMIDVFSMSTSGRLTPVSGSPFSNGTAYNSFALALSPNNQYLFSSDSFSSSITTFSVASDGSLSPVDGSPFHTTSWEGGVAVSGEGDYLYSADFAAAGVVVQSIASNGTLTDLGEYLTGEISPSGELNTLAAFPPPACH